MSNVISLKYSTGKSTSAVFYFNNNFNDSSQDARFTYTFSPEQSGIRVFGDLLSLRKNEKENKINDILIGTKSSGSDVRFNELIRYHKYVPKAIKFDLTKSLELEVNNLDGVEPNAILLDCIVDDAYILDMDYNKYARRNHNYIGIPDSYKLFSLSVNKLSIINVGYSLREFTNNVYIAEGYSKFLGYENDKVNYLTLDFGTRERFDKSVYVNNKYTRLKYLYNSIESTDLSKLLEYRDNKINKLYGGVQAKELDNNTTFDDYIYSLRDLNNNLSENNQPKTLGSLNDNISVPELSKTLVDLFNEVSTHSFDMKAYRNNMRVTSQVESKVLKSRYNLIGENSKSIFLHRDTDKVEKFYTDKMIGNYNYDVQHNFGDVFVNTPDTSINLGNDILILHRDSGDRISVVDNSLGVTKDLQELYRSDVYMNITKSYKDVWLNKHFISIEKNKYGISRNESYDEISRNDLIVNDSEMHSFAEVEVNNLKVDNTIILGNTRIDDLMVVGFENKRGKTLQNRGNVSSFAHFLEKGRLFAQIFENIPQISQGDSRKASLNSSTLLSSGDNIIGVIDSIYGASSSLKSSSIFDSSMLCKHDMKSINVNEYGYIMQEGSKGASTNIGEAILSQYEHSVKINYDSLSVSNSNVSGTVFDEVIFTSNDNKYINTNESVFIGDVKFNTMLEKHSKMIAESVKSSFIDSSIINASSYNKRIGVIDSSMLVNNKINDIFKDTLSIRVSNIDKSLMDTNEPIMLNSSNYSLGINRECSFLDNSTKYISVINAPISLGALNYNTSLSHDNISLYEYGKSSIVNDFESMESSSNKNSFIYDSIGFAEKELINTSLQHDSLSLHKYDTNAFMLDGIEHLKASGNKSSLSDGVLMAFKEGNTLGLFSDGDKYLSRGGANSLIDKTSILLKSGNNTLGEPNDSTISLFKGESYVNKDVQLNKTLSDSGERVGILNTEVAIGTGGGKSIQQGYIIPFLSDSGDTTRILDDRAANISKAEKDFNITESLSLLSGGKDIVFEEGFFGYAEDFVPPIEILQGAIDELLLPREEHDYSDYKSSVFGDNNTVRVRHIKGFSEEGNPIINLPIENPLKYYSKLSEEYIDVDVKVMRKVIELLYKNWRENIHRHAGMEAKKAMNNILENTHNELKVWYTSVTDPNRIKSAERSLKLFAWYCEMGILSHSNKEVKYNRSDAVLGFWDKLPTYSIDANKSVKALSNEEVDELEGFTYSNANPFILTSNRGEVSTFKVKHLPQHINTNLKLKAYIKGSGELCISTSDDEYRYNGKMNDINIELPSDNNSFTITFTPSTDSSFVDLANFIITDRYNDSYELGYTGKVSNINYTIQYVLDFMTIAGDSIEDVQPVFKTTSQLAYALDKFREYMEIHHDNKHKGKRLTIRKS